MLKADKVNNHETECNGSDREVRGNDRCLPLRVVATFVLLSGNQNTDRSASHPGRHRINGRASRQFEDGSHHFSHDRSDVVHQPEFKEKRHHQAGKKEPGCEHRNQFVKHRSAGKFIPDKGRTEFEKNHYSENRTEKTHYEPEDGDVEQAGKKRRLHNPLRLCRTGHHRQDNGEHEDGCHKHRNRTGKQTEEKFGQNANTDCPLAHERDRHEKQKQTE